MVPPAWRFWISPDIMSEARRIPETGQLSFPFPAQPPAAEVEPLVTAPIRNGFLIRLGPRDAIAVRLVAYGSPRDDVFTCLKVERIACPPSLAAPARDPDPEYFALPEYWPLENRVVRAAMAARGRGVGRSTGASGKGGSREP